MIGLARWYPVCAGFVAMFAFTWPVDLWAAAGSHGWVAAPPLVLPLLVGYGFVIAAVLMTGIVDGRRGIRALLRRFLVWRVGARWYLVTIGVYGFDGEAFLQCVLKREELRASLHGM